MRYGTAQIYANHVAEFADWLQMQSGFDAVINPDPWVPATSRHWSEVQKRVERDILGHLYRATREGRGLNLVRASKQHRPRWDLSHQLARSRHDGSMDHPEARVGYQPAAMPLADYLRLLRATKSNESWRNLCLWLLLGAGCCRISEALNLFATDVRRVLLASENVKSHITTDEAYVSLANPVEGLVETQSGQWLKRRDFLSERYGIVPRNLLPTENPLYAGYKGMALAGTIDSAIPELELWPERGWALVEWLFPCFGRLFAYAYLMYRRHLIQSGISVFAQCRHP
jgi:hypothetical protein